jgi:hypothetical protein
VLSDGTVRRIFARLTFNPSPEDLKDAWSEIRRHNFLFLECALGAASILHRSTEADNGLFGGVLLREFRIFGKKHPEIFKDYTN